LNLVGFWVLANSVAEILFKIGNDKTLSPFKSIMAAEENTDRRVAQAVLRGLV